MPITRSRVSVLFTIAIFGAVACVDKQKLPVIFFVGSSLVGTGVALLMEMVFGIPFLSLVRTCLSTSMTVNGLVVRYRSLLYHTEVVLSSTIKEIGGRLT